MGHRADRVEALTAAPQQMTLGITLRGAMPHLELCLAIQSLAPVTRRTAISQRPPFSQAWIAAPMPTRPVARLMAACHRCSLAKLFSLAPWSTGSSAASRAIRHGPDLALLTRTAQHPKASGQRGAMKVIQLQGGRSHHHPQGDSQLPARSIHSCMVGAIVWPADHRATKWLMPEP